MNSLRKDLVNKMSVKRQLVQLAMSNYCTWKTVPVSVLHYHYQFLKNLTRILFAQPICLEICLAYYKQSHLKLTFLTKDPLHTKDVAK